MIRVSVEAKLTKMSCIAAAQAANRAVHGGHSSTVAVMRILLCLATFAVLVTAFVANKRHRPMSLRAATQEASTAPAITPTGRADNYTPVADRQSIAAAQAIRHALDADEKLSDAPVVVTPAANRVVITGTVSDEKEKSAIIRKADKAAHKSNLDFDLTIQDQ
jgi:hypothetical protein